MKQVVICAIWLSLTVAVRGKTIITGCVTDANGNQVAGAKVFVAGNAKIFRAETRKSDGCYQIQVKKDGIYSVGLRAKRFDGHGLVQKQITVAGLDIPDVNLTTDVPNKTQIKDTVAKAVLSASKGFSAVRKGISHADVPEIEAEAPSGFSGCRIQFHKFDTAFPERMPTGATVMWYCAFGGAYSGIRNEEVAHAMFETVRDAITTALASLEQLHYSTMERVNSSCNASINGSDRCVQQIVWASPINGVLTLTQTQWKWMNGLFLWAVYNMPMTEEGCASLQKNEEAKVDFEKYQSAVSDMQAEEARQLKAAIKGELRNVFGAAIGGPGFIGSAQQAGLASEVAISPNSCIVNHGVLQVVQ